MIYDRISDLEVAIEGYELSRRERETSSGFTRVTTTVSLHGDQPSRSMATVRRDVAKT